jgi:hypothetical protein
VEIEMKLCDYLATQPNAAVTELLETPRYSYTGFIHELKRTLGEDLHSIDERWLRDLKDPELHKAYDLYLHYCDSPKQRIAA